MINKTINWNHYPNSVKTALKFLVTGWLIHLVFYFQFLATDQLTRNDYLMVGVGAAICYFVAGINKWARSLCIFFNIGIIAIYLVLLVFSQAGFGRHLLEGLVVITFGLSTFFLVQKETSAFFKEYNRPPQSEEPADP